MSDSGPVAADPRLIALLEVAQALRVAPPSWSMEEETVTASTAAALADSPLADVLTEQEHLKLVLQGLLVTRKMVEILEGEVITAARAAGVTWKAISDCLDMTEHGVRKRHANNPELRDLPDAVVLVEGSVYSIRRSVSDGAFVSTASGGGRSVPGGDATVTSAAELLAEGVRQVRARPEDGVSVKDWATAPWGVHPR